MPLVVPKETYDPDKVGEQIRALYASPEGQKAMREGAAQAQQACRDLEESLRVDWRTLDEPMTPFPQYPLSK